MNGAQERFLYGQENFLIVARGLFRRDALKGLRARIAARRAAIRADDERSRKGEEVGVAPDELRLSEEWYEIWKQAELAKFCDYVPAFSEVIYPPQIRTVRNLRAMVPWHQDAAYMEALGKRGHSEVITCFIPLEDDAENRPTLQFCIDPGQGPVQPITHKNVTFNQFDLAGADQPLPDKCRTFKLKLGDAFVFGKYVLHRTYVESDMFAERNSMEFRLTTAKGVVPGKDYFSLNMMRFYRAGTS